MKRSLILVMLAPLAALAGDFGYYTFSPVVAASNQTAYVTNLPQSGVLRSLSVAVAGGAATVRVSTVVGQGLSIGAARTLVAPVTVGANGTNVLPSLYIGNERLVARVDSAPPFSNVSVHIGYLLEE